MGGGQSASECVSHRARSWYVAEKLALAPQGSVEVSSSSSACLLSGPELRPAVDAALQSVNLLHVANKQAGKYSGGMKRRLSVAISFVGNPKVVYLDEPSTVSEMGPCP